MVFLHPLQDAYVREAKSTPSFEHNSNCRPTMNKCRLLSKGKKRER
jgi:hypothetical protein